MRDALPRTARPSLDHALAALGDLGARRAVLRERLGAPGGARAVEEIARRSVEGVRDARDAAVALASTLVAMRRDREDEALGALRAEAAREGLAVAAALLADAPAHRAIAPRGRLREVCIGERAPLVRQAHAGQLALRHPWLVELRRRRVAEALAVHPSPILVARLLAAPWLGVEGALIVAARRPTTPAISFALAGSDRWLSHLEVREAMAQNPFTPTGIVLALLPAIGAPLLRHLRDAGDAHPQVAHAAALLLAASARALVDPRQEQIGHPAPEGQR